MGIVLEKYNINNSKSINYNIVPKINKHNNYQIYQYCKLNFVDVFFYYIL